MANSEDAERDLEAGDQQRVAALVAELNLLHQRWIADPLEGDRKPPSQSFALALRAYSQKVEATLRAAGEWADPSE